MRDLLLRRVPAVFGGNALYATVAVAASAVMVVASYLGSPTIGIIAAIVLSLGLRYGAVKRGLGAAERPRLAAEVDPRRAAPARRRLRPDAVRLLRRPVDGPASGASGRTPAASGLTTNRTPTTETGPRRTLALASVPRVSTPATTRRSRHRHDPNVPVRPSTTGGRGRPRAARGTDARRGRLRRTARHHRAGIGTSARRTRHVVPDRHDQGPRPDARRRRPHTEDPASRGPGAPARRGRAGVRRVRTAREPARHRRRPRRVQQGAVYSNFASKQDLVAEVMQRQTNLVLASLRGRRRAGPGGGGHRRRPPRRVRSARPDRAVRPVVRVPGLRDAARGVPARVRAPTAGAAGRGARARAGVVRGTPEVSPGMPLEDFATLLVGANVGIVFDAPALPGLTRATSSRPWWTRWCARAEPRGAARAAPGPRGVACVLRTREARRAT